MILQMEKNIAAKNNSQANGNRKMRNRRRQRQMLLIRRIRAMCIFTAAIFLVILAVSPAAKKIMASRQIPVQKQRFIVCIDPGHGGKDIGTSNPRTGTIEKDITLQIGNRIVEELKKYSNIEVITTRTDDTFVSLDDRNKMKTDNNADLFVSIHCNATPDGKSNADGIETFYWSENRNGSNILAQKVHQSITSELNVRDRGIKRADYQVLKNSKIPSILIETGFLTNDEEEQNLLDENYQLQLARAIAKGIVEYTEKSSK